MKNTKKVLSGVLALTMVASFAACGGDDTTNNNNNNSNNANNGADTAATTEATTTTAATVAVNTEGLQEGEQEVIESAMSQLQDVELENKEIKWLAHYTKNPGTDGQSKGVGLEMFEQKYGGYITDYSTTWETRFNDLSTYVLGGEGIDFWPGDDVYNFPKGVNSGMFQPIDDYIDINSAIWQNTKEGMEKFNFGGKHFSFVTQITAEQVCMYNKTTIEENGLDDPWELYEAGNWNWDTFKGMLEEFVDEENDLYGLDGWYYEKALWTSSGAVAVDNVDGHVVSMLDSAAVENAENFGYELFQKGLILNLEPFSWNIQPQFMGEGKELFLLWGSWGVNGDPSTWMNKIDPDDLGIVPVPSPAGSNPYQAATIAGYALCKGATNPKGVALFAECDIVAANDEGATAIANRKAKDDNKWTDEVIEHINICNDLARQYPVYDFAAGSSTDIAAYTVDSGDVGLRAPFHGTSDWATQREALADTIGLMVQEVDNELQAKIAEFNS
ncbi:MAG: hypothetical protein J1E40_11640 [Oscillospiraceae bacterium]|nr:hypothetical protein [Oscillospiraceae bacterium]